MTDHILVPLDGSGVAEAALVHAAALAKLLGARITLARVPETMIVPVADGGAWLTQTMESDEARRRADEYLRAVASRPALHGLAVDCVTPAYPVVAGLFSAVEERGVDLVVMTSHGHTGAARWVFGGVAHKMVRGSPVPVYVLRAPRGAEGEEHAPPPPAPAFQTIVVPLDGSQLAESALASATELARAGGGTLHLVTVPTIPGYFKALTDTAPAMPDALRERMAEADEYLAEVAGRLRATGVAAAAEVELVVSGSVADGLLDYVVRSEADVLVMSTHGRSGLGRWLFGSVAERLLGASPVPVWVVRAGS